jgi:rubrerythrin
VVLLIVHFLLLFIKGGQVIPITKENLKKAFACESQANQKYRAFAKKAERNEFKNHAKLFKLTLAATE